MTEKVYNDIKVYQINLDFFELKSFKNDFNGAIGQIIKYHKQNFKTAYDLTHSEERITIGECSYTLYSFNETEKESIWKDFFPKELVKGKDFTIKSTSFSLFIHIESRLFCVIGGKGISVIKRFINQSFGLDFYEKLAEPENDIVYSHISRGVSGNLTSEQRTFRNEQKLQDILSIGRVPKKFFLQLRKDLKDTIFDFIDFGESENIYIEIGSAFCIKWKITFGQLHELIIKVNEVLNSSVSKSISRFERIVDNEMISTSLIPALLVHLREDMVRLSSDRINYNMLLDYDFVHPSKLNIFYECDEYKAYLKGSQSPFYETRDRLTLYYSILKHIYSLVEPTDEFEFRRIISGVRIKGFIGDQKKTEAMFIHHVTCELNFLARPYFLIDTLWYQVKGDFVDSINEQCLQILKRNNLTPNPLDIEWTSDQTEGEYNLMYKDRPGYFVLDKMLGQNIELCDILYETDYSLFLIHVKDGFDAKIRDLTNQISISSNRLWNDLKSDHKFLNSVFNSYTSSGNSAGSIGWSDFYKKFKTKEIIYVLAFRPNTNIGTVTGNLESHKSNIAKFSIIQCFREQVDNYQIKIIEIEKIAPNKTYVLLPSAV